LAKFVIKIDHHIPIADYGDLIYVDITRPATAQIILEFYLRFQEELKINMAAATPQLYIRGLSPIPGDFVFVPLTLILSSPLPIFCNMV